MSFGNAAEVVQIDLAKRQRTRFHTMFSVGKQDCATTSSMTLNKMKD